MQSNDTILGPGGKRRLIGPGGEQKNLIGPGGTQQIFDFSKSNMILMIGGQILILAIILMIVMFGTAPLTFPAQAMRNTLTRLNSGMNTK